MLFSPIRPFQNTEKNDVLAARRLTLIDKVECDRTSWADDVHSTNLT
ncbi:hypothetical protein S7335_2201 [Synechococcus sp. PCC 7335]|nr:hypothetical protein S7335_2201 [Synechococcus sp. PCC 7335]